MKNWLYVSSLLLFVACAPSKKSMLSPGKTSETIQTTDSIRKQTELKPTKRPVYRETETLLTDLIHTKLEVSFDWNLAQMQGVETLTAKPHFYPSDSLILDAKGMAILSVQMEGKNLAYSYDSSFLKIKLGKTFTRNEPYTLTIAYVAKPNERKTSGNEAITSDKGLYFINPKGEDKSKMPQIWTQGETEANSVWFPTIDAPNVKTTQEIFITVDNKYVTLSNGKLISSKKNPNGTRTDYWKQDLPHAPYLFMMGIGAFKVVNDYYVRPNGSKMDVNYYVEPEWEPHARAIFGETPAMISYFSKLLGVEYPWEKYHQMVVRDYVSGAMENTGAVIFGDFVYKNKRELLDDNDQSTIAHELFHHWFGDLVTCESWSNLPLNESFANYSQYLWDEHRYGLDEADYQADIEADGYFQSAQSEGYHNLIWFDYDAKDQMFDAHSYNKGGRILHMLRSYLGDEAFFKGIQNYLISNKFKAAEFHQLRIAFEEVCGEDLNWFFNQWFLGSGHPVLDVSQRFVPALNKVFLRVKQVQNTSLSPIFHLPVDVAVYDETGKHIQRIIVDQLDQEFSFHVTGKLKGLVFDDKQMLLAKLREEKPLEQWVHQYYNGQRYKTRRAGLLMAMKKNDEQTQQLLVDALKDSFWDIRLKAIERAVKLTKTNKSTALNLIKELSMKDSCSKVRAAALNFIAGNENSAMVKTLCEDRIQNDPSYLVVSEALKHLGKLDPDLAMKMAKILESERSAKMLSGIGKLYAAYGTKESYSFFENTLKNGFVQGFDQLELMNSLTYFVAKLAPEDIERSFTLYHYLNEKGGHYTQLFLPQNVSYLLSMVKQKIETLQEDLNTKEGSEKTNTQNDLKRYLSLKEQLMTLLATLKTNEVQTEE
jgi:aminopeptidase N